MGKVGDDGFRLLRALRRPLHRHAVVCLDAVECGRGAAVAPGLDAALEGLLASGIYHQLFLAHVKTPWKGVRGPFRVDSIAAAAFEPIPPYAVAPMVQDILEASRWKTPEVGHKEIGAICGMLERLAGSCQQALRLRLCDAFNARDPMHTAYEHEWAHALLEFHEFLLYQPDASRLHVLNLVYE